MGTAEPLAVGRYTLYDALASGGMATVHLGRLVGEGGFSRTVAIKRLHPQFARDAAFVSMFMDEARLAGRIRHPNVVPVVDVVASNGELLLVMEYVHGETLSRVLRALVAHDERVPPPIAAAIMCDVLEGLHAAHEARDEKGEPLGIVHRDVSPQNIIVGADGVARVLDFGIAKAVGNLQETREGQLKGKLSYMAPEQLDQDATRSTDVFAASIVFWEMLTCKRLFHATTEAQVVMKILAAKVEAPSKVAPIADAWDAIVLRGLAADPKARFASAREMSAAVAKCAPKAEPSEVAEWLASHAHDALAARAAVVSNVESAPSRARMSAIAAPADALTKSDLSRDTPASGKRRSTGLFAGAIVTAVTAVAITVAIVVSRQQPARGVETSVSHSAAPLMVEPSAATPAPQETIAIVAVNVDAAAVATVAAPAPTVKPRLTPTARVVPSSASAKTPDFL